MTEEITPEPDPQPLRFTDRQAFDARMARSRNVKYDSRYYASDMFYRPEQLVNDYLEKLSDLPEHDTLVGTGLSGSIAAGMLAVATGKMYAVVRKIGVDTHSQRVVEGLVGEHWLFVDDFIATGNTQRRVIKTMTHETGSEFVGSWLFRPPHFQPPTQAHGYEAPKPKIEPLRETVFDLDELPQDGLIDLPTLTRNETMMRQTQMEMYATVAERVRQGGWCALPPGDYTVTMSKEERFTRTFGVKTKEEILDEVRASMKMMSTADICGELSKTDKKADENL